MFGSFIGGALCLDDGGKFQGKRQWYEYDGVNIGHQVAPFEGERLSLVIYSLKVNRSAVCAPAIPVPPPWVEPETVRPSAAPR